MEQPLAQLEQLMQTQTIPQFPMLQSQAVRRYSSSTEKDMS